MKSDADLIEALGRGDESAFTALVECYHQSLLRLAIRFVRNPAIAEEVVQQTWVGVIEGLDRFEGRSSLKTWIFRILTNQAKTVGIREHRRVQLTEGDTAINEMAVDPKRFQTSGAVLVGHWAFLPGLWSDDTPEKLLLTKESRLLIDKAIDELPPVQRQVIILRDVEGCKAEEVCNLLEISKTNQRVLLHRARSKVRSALERYLDQSERTS